MPLLCLWLLLKWTRSCSAPYSVMSAAWPLLSQIYRNSTNRSSCSGTWSGTSTSRSACRKKDASKCSAVTENTKRWCKSPHLISARNLTSLNLSGASVSTFMQIWLFWTAGSNLSQTSSATCWFESLRIWAMLPPMIWSLSRKIWLTYSCKAGRCLKAKTQLTKGLLKSTVRSETYLNQ